MLCLIIGFVISCSEIALTDKLHSFENFPIPKAPPRVAIHDLRFDRPL